jgi:prepilin-type processing-associated H-X9-DG protein
MTEPIHQQLLGHLLGALDDDEQERLDARLERDNECCREFVRLRRRLARLEAMRPEFDPPPGLAERTCHSVAVYAAAEHEAKAHMRPRMSPNPVPHSRVNHIRRLDLATAAALVLVLGSLVPPAIDGSRSQARVAVCQDGLRQLGLSFEEYSDMHGEPLSRLAANCNLTGAGLWATRLFEDSIFGDSRSAVCPDAWLAAQGVLRKPLLRELRSTACQRFETSDYDWPGTWRDGMTDGPRLSQSQADSPLLADAPSADLPGQVSESHGGRGRNVLFEDGHIRLLPPAMYSDADDGLFSLDEPLPGADVSAPIILASGR